MQENQADSKFYKLSQFCILAIVFLVPFWFLPTTSAPVEFNKIFLVSILVIASFAFYLIHSILRARISIAVHKVFILGASALLFWFLSAIFSKAGPQAIFGVGAESSSFFITLILFLLAYLITILFSEEKHLKKLFLAFSGGFVIFAVFALASIFGLGKFIGGILENPFFNTIGSWNSISLASAFFVMMVLPFLPKVSGIKRLILGILFATFLFLMFLVNFPLTWIFLGVFSLVFLSYAIWKKNTGKFNFVLGVVLLFVSIFGFSFGGTVSGALGIVPPIEVSVSHRATIDVIKNSVKDDLFFGNGPTTFRYVWDLYKPSDVNQTVFWGTRFDSGSSYLLSLPVEIGLIGWILFLGFLVYLWHLGLRMISTKQKVRALFLSPFFLFSYTILMWAFYPVGFTLLCFGFLSIGFLLATLKIQGSIKIYDISLFGEGSFGFISALVVVVITLLSIGGVYISISKYIGQVLFAGGVSAFNDGNMDAAENKILLASKIYGRNSEYFSALSQIYFQKAQMVLQDKATPAELLGSRFKETIDKAFGVSQNAIKISPLDFAGFQALGKIYELLVSLNVDGASQAALEQYDESLKRSPRNPAIFRDKALIYITESFVKKNSGSLELAEKELLKSIEIKPDYAAAHFLLAQIFDTRGNSLEAIKRGESAALIAPNDIGTLFQLGLLYYKNNRLKDAETVFKRATSINPNYSNARYFLGFVYDRTKRKDEAILEFEKISSLNPGNAEILKILSNLNEGKSALTDISPPALYPEERGEEPVKDRAERSMLGR